METGGVKQPQKKLKNQPQNQIWLLPRLLEKALKL
jgi:hypothetical protein